MMTLLAWLLLVGSLSLRMTALDDLPGPPKPIVAQNDFPAPPKPIVALEDLPGPPKPGAPR